MIDSFLRYSLEEGRKIAVVLLRDGRMQKKNLTVCSIDEENGFFTAVAAGRRRSERFPLEEVLTCDYARGDHGELEGMD